MKISPTLLRFVLAAFLLPLAVTATTCHAAVLAADFVGGLTYQRGTYQNLGWYFDLTTTVQVGSLGVFDTGANGLVDPHQVGIWDSAGNLLATTTVTSADPLTPSASSLGGWRFDPITPVTLTPGAYTIGTYYPTSADYIIGSATSLTISPGITYVSGGITPGSISGFHDLTGTYTGADPGFFGANFLVVPEPGSLGLLAASLVAVLGAVARSRGRQSWRIIRDRRSTRNR